MLHEVLGTTPFAPNAFGCQAPDSGNGEVLALAGSAEQKERYLEPLLAGDLKSAFSMTEPDTAGSDPTTLKTRAVRDGDDYVISGRKWFSSNASIADFLIVMAVTDPDARPHQRATMFLVDADTPGVNILRDVPTMEHPWEAFGKLGGHAEIVYEDVRIPATQRLGAEGEGFLIAQQRLYPGRIHHCMRWLGVAQRAFDMLCERATYRVSGGRTLGEHQTVQNWIADSAAQMQAARLMTLHAAWVMDTQGVSAARTPISLIKFYGAGVLHDVIDRALQVHGSLGFSTDLPLEGDVPLRARRADLRRPRRGPPPVGRPPDPARLRTTGRRVADRARADPPGGSARALRKRARRGHRQRLTSSCRPAPARGPCRVSLAAAAVPAFAVTDPPDDEQHRRDQAQAVQALVGAQLRAARAEVLPRVSASARAGTDAR